MRRRRTNPFAGYGELCVDVEKSVRSFARASVRVL